MASIDVLITTSQGIIYEGRAESAILPGEWGVFEVLPYHKPLLSRLISGIITVDNKRLEILRGVVQVKGNKVTAIVETP
jgi:F0F1-type ATP synthase epsilon subunit